MYASLTIRNAFGMKAIVDAINNAPIVEGIEGVEFTAEQLAGQYAAEAEIAADSGYLVDENALWVHLKVLEENGAQFNFQAAIDHGLAFADALARLE